jgi:hypothetical protein
MKKFNFSVFVFASLVFVAMLISILVKRKKVLRVKQADELEIAVTGFTPEKDFDRSGFIIYTAVAANAEHSVVTDRGSGICMTEI